MNKNLAIFGLAAAATTAFAGGSLFDITWEKDMSWQVQTPEVVACTGGAPGEMTDYGQACFESTAGWWFAYDATKSWDDESQSMKPNGTVANVQPSTTNPDGTWKLITTDETEGGMLAGGNLDPDKGIWAELSATGVSTSVPGVTGIGFNWKKDESYISITDKGGFCLAYSYSGNGVIQMELGWPDNTYGYDTWYLELPDGSNAITVGWNDFQQDEWDDKHSTTVQTATDYAVSLKFRLKNGTTSPQTVTFGLTQLGWQAEGKGCGAGAPSTGIAAVNSAAAAKVLLNNRTLSIAGLSASANVEVVNLRGQVVASKVLSGSATMSLASLDAGVYMVRVQGKSVNYSQKVILK